MSALRRLGASLLAFGLGTAGVVLLAPQASAHTGTLQTSAVCDDSGSYVITYTGTTQNVPASGSGHTATLTIGEVQPAGSTISGAPATVVGNTTYTFTQTVPGNATYAQATAFLAWGDGAKSDPIGKTNLTGNCSPKQETKPSGALATDCVDNGGHVYTTKLDNGTYANVSWRLVTGNGTVVAGPTTGSSLSATGLADNTTVKLQYDAGNGWTDEGSTKTTGTCTPQETKPSGALDTDCVYKAGHVFATKLDNGSFTTVQWRLVTDNGTVVGGPTTGLPLNADDLPDNTKVSLQYNVGNGWVNEGSTATTGHCAPVKAPSGSLDTNCDNGGGHVATKNLDNGGYSSVQWRLVAGGNVIAGPASGNIEASGLDDSTTVKLQYNTGSGWVDEGSTVTTGNCTPGESAPTGSFTVLCSEAGAKVTLGTLGSGSKAGVVWTLTHNGTAVAVHSGDVVNVPALATLSLAYRASDNSTAVVQTGTAPDKCVRSLGIVKSVSPTGSASFGDTLTYTLVVSAGGTLGQSNVNVSDYIPGYDPAKASSGTTTYVNGSARCDGTCTVTYHKWTKKITWALGDMAPGTTRTVSFKVTIDTPKANANGGVPGVTIYNTGAVGSTETPKTPSNQVKTPVTAVEGVKHERKPPSKNQGSSLPHTGSSLPVGWLLTASGLLVVTGMVMLGAARRED